jgi:cytochrome P450
MPNMSECNTEKAKRIAPGPLGLISVDADFDPLRFLGRMIEQYGDVVRYQTRLGTCFFFTHPKHVETVLHRENFRRAALGKMMLGDGLLSSDGPHWRSQRRLMQRDFLPANITPFASIIAEQTQRTASDWRAAARAKKPVNIATAMTALTLHIVVRALFSEDLNDERADELRNAITKTIDDLGEMSVAVFGVEVQIAPDRRAKFSAAMKVIDAFCSEMIARRRAQSASERPRDLLTLLIETRELNDRQVRDEIVTMLIAGHETTALAIAWGWKTLAENPHAEKKLHEEVDAVLAGRHVELADVQKLTWTAATFQETMRLYPPVWQMPRVAIEDDEIDGYEIPRNACVIISPWFTHRHKDFWRDPETFDPARFTKSAEKQLHRYAYLPFAGGRHQCVGMHFALMEGTMILAELARQFCVVPLNSAQVRPAMGITLRQSPGLMANIELRKLHAEEK